MKRTVQTKLMLSREETRRIRAAADRLGLTASDIIRLSLRETSFGAALEFGLLIDGPPRQRQARERLGRKGE